MSVVGVDASRFRINRATLRLTYVLRVFMWEEFLYSGNYI